MNGSDVAPPTRILLVSGMPGSGKSSFLHELERRGWGILVGDDLVSGTPTEAAWNSALLHANDGPLFAVAGRYSTGFAIEFGFPVGWLARVERMRMRGYETWYFDADPAASRLAWLEAHPETDEGVWRKQAGELIAIRDRITASYRDHLIKTLSDEAGHVGLEQVARILDLRW
jgi:hypothetical protein